MWRTVGCKITNTKSPICELGWWTRADGVVYSTFTPFDQPEVYHTYGESRVALTAAIVRLEGLPETEAVELAKRRIYQGMQDYLGTSSEIARLRSRYKWHGW